MNSLFIFKQLVCGGKRVVHSSLYDSFDLFFTQISLETVHVEVSDPV